MSALPAAPAASPAEQALAKVLKISRANGWSIAIVAGLCALGSLAFGDLVGGAVGLLATAAGVMEIRGHRLLSRRDAAGMKQLVQAELFLLAILATYAITRLASFDRDAVLANLTPDMQAMLKQAGIETGDIVPLVRLFFLATYGSVLAATFLYQGGMALYYRRRAALVTEAIERLNRPLAFAPPPSEPPPTQKVYRLRADPPATPTSPPAAAPASATDLPFFPQDIIIKKRDGGALTREEIEFFASGVSDGRFADYQATALLMAVFWRGMSAQETAWLTDAMMRSGEVIDLRDVPGAKVDKHSTGGVGDKVSLILAPLAAACGLKVPMMSGRGLGHTGGTLDKLEAIPGFRVGLSVPEFRSILRRTGVAMIGQTPQVVPADRKLYALRDVTGTVECIPLICASIMSKKLAEGIDSLVLDVKFGRGAFMKRKDDALALARAMVEVGRAAGKPVRALLTAMNQPLGRAAGHTTEVIESIECLKGRGPADLMEVTLGLTAHMLMLGGVAKDETDARKKMSAAIANGSALQKFREMCVAQGGDHRVVEDYTLLPTAQKLVEVRAPADARGFVSEVDALKCGHAIMALGGGRASVTARVDHAVGLADLIKIGEPVSPGARLCTLHVNDDAKGARAEAFVREAVKFSPTSPQIEPLVQELIQ
jgi:pyrimidine-nucleoside phosphorylase